MKIDINGDFLRQECGRLQRERAAGGDWYWGEPEFTNWHGLHGTREEAIKDARERLLAAAPGLDRSRPLPQVLGESVSGQINNRHRAKKRVFNNTSSTQY